MIQHPEHSEARREQALGAFCQFVHTLSLPAVDKLRLTNLMQEVALASAAEAFAKSYRVLTDKLADK